MRQEIIPFVADSTGLKLTASIPGNARFAIVGIIGPQEIGESYNVHGLNANGVSPLSGALGFRLDAIMSGTNGPARFFPGTGVRSLGIPGAAWIVEPNASVTLSLTATGVASGTVTDSEDRAAIGLIAIPLPNDAPLELIPRVRIVNAAFTWAVGTQYAETANLAVIGQYPKSKIHLVELQARKTNTAANSVITFGATNFLSISRKEGGQGRVPIRGRIATEAIAGNAANQIAGLLPMTMSLELVPGEYVNIDMLDSGDGVAAAKQADFVLFGYELPN